MNAWSRHARETPKDPRARGRVPRAGVFGRAHRWVMTRRYPPHPDHHRASSHARARPHYRARRTSLSLVAPRVDETCETSSRTALSFVMRVPEPTSSSDDETNETNERGDDDAHCRACGHDHAPGTTCGVCGHHREKCDRKANGVAECAARRRGDPIIEVIDKFLCLGAFEHTCREEVLLACGIRTVMNVRVVFVW